MHTPPLHTHDSDLSHFLGHFMDPSSGRTADLYFQSGTPGLPPTVIARFGPDGDYRSGIGASFGGDSALFEARQRAQDAGLISYCPSFAAQHLDRNDPLALQEFLTHAPQPPSLRVLLDGEMDGPQKDYDRRTLLPYLEANAPEYLSSLHPAHYRCIKDFGTTARTLYARYLITRLYETAEFQCHFLAWYNTQPDYTKGSL